MNTVNLEKINLRKEVVNQISLSKGIGNIKARVCLAIDRSGSMSSLYRNGFVQEVVERIIPIALQFDDNQSLEVFPFHSNCFQSVDVNINNFDGYVNREIVNKISEGGTNYSPVLRKIFDVSPHKSNSGLFGMFGRKTIPLTYVIFITDGDNSDKVETTQKMIDLSKEPIFWQFVGIGSDSFNYLEKLDNLTGRTVDNAGFFKVKDIRNMSDSDLYNSLLKEFPEYIAKVKAMGLI